MAITRYAGDRFYGLDAEKDILLSQVLDGAIYKASDTLKEYLKVSGYWYLSGGTGSSGSNGLPGGINYFFNESLASGVSSYKQLSRNVTSTGEVIVTTALTALQTTVPISSYITDAGDPNSVVIPPGIWSAFINLSKNAQSDNLEVYYRVYKRDSGGTETLLYTSDLVAIGWSVNNTTAVESKIDVIFSSTSLNASDRILIKFYANNLDNASRTIKLYTEGSQHYSYIVTTVAPVSGSSGSIGSAGSLGSQGGTGGIGSLGSTGGTGAQGGTGGIGSLGSKGGTGAQGGTGGIGSLGSTGSSASLSGTSGYLSKFNSATTLVNSVVYENSSNIGIGTTSPAALLHVQTSQNSETTLIVNNTNAGTAAAARLDLQSNASNYLTLQSYGQNYSGNVCGIAAAKLNTILDNALTANSTGLLIGTTSTNPMYFVTANAVKMTLNASGNLGIGASSPAYKLDVTGEIRQTGNNFWFSSARIAGDGSGNIDINYNNGSSPSFTWYNGGTSTLARITSTGNMGIGTSSPNSKLEVYSTSWEPAIRLTSTSGSVKTYGLVVNPSWATGSFHIYDYTLDYSRLQISTTGNVGIGVGASNPGYTLEVNGTQRVVGNFYLFNTVVNPASNFANQRGVGFEASTGKLEVAAS